MKTITTEHINISFTPWRCCRRCIRYPHSSPQSHTVSSCPVLETWYRIDSRRSTSAINTVAWVRQIQRIGESESARDSSSPSHHHRYHRHHHNRQREIVRYSQTPLRHQVIRDTTGQHTLRLLVVFISSPSPPFPPPSSMPSSDRSPRGVRDSFAESIPESMTKVIK